MSQDLEALRDNLESINRELFLTISKRRAVALQIQTEKLSEKRECYDPSREFTLYQRFEREIVSLSEKELLSISLVIESQAQSHTRDAYPSWSKRSHLKSHRGTLVEMVNPMLLFFYDKNIFNSLDLRDELRQVILKQIS